MTVFFYIYNQKRHENLHSKSQPSSETYYGWISQNLDYCWIYIRFYSENWCRLKFLVVDSILFDRLFFTSSHGMFMINQNKIDFQTNVCLLTMK